MPRLFVALDLPDAYKHRLSSLRDEALHARWTPIEQIHLTLRFVGNVRDEIASAVVEALADVRAEPFTLAGTGVGAFPSLRRPRVLFGAVERTPGLLELQRQIENAVQQAGLEPDDKPFTPHVTFARLKQAGPHEVRTYLQSLPELRLEPHTVTGFHLYESKLHPKGAIHRRMRTFTLES